MNLNQIKALLLDQSTYTLKEVEDRITEAFWAGYTLRDNEETEEVNEN